MMETNPRRRVDWLYTILGGAIVLGLGWMGSTVSTGIDGLKEDVGDLKIEVAELRTTVKIGMSDRFTGTEGAELRHRLDALEVRCVDTRDKLDYHLTKGAFETHKVLHERMGNGK